MRYPVEQKAETHERIIDAAARSFRELGSEGQGVAQLMKNLGLTVSAVSTGISKVRKTFYGDAITRGFSSERRRIEWW